jgi:predicted aspartyl protease
LSKNLVDRAIVVYIATFKGIPYDNLNLNQAENSEIVEAVAIQIAIPVAVPVTEIRNENIVRVIKINPTENDILERKLLEIGILH